MIMAKKILIPIFNRAHYGRLRSVLREVKNHKELELQIMVGLPKAYGGLLENMKYSRPHSWRLAIPWYLRARVLNIISRFKPDVLKSDFLVRNIIADGFQIQAKVPLFLDGGASDTMAKVVGLGMIKVVEVLRELKPDLVFVNADRFEMMAVTLAAAYLNIPIAHNEGGDISGTIDESIRHAITKLSHIHFVSTDASHRRVLQMGENPATVFTVGSPAIDVISQLDTKLDKNIIPDFPLTQPYLLVLLHPVATADESENQALIENLIKAIETMGMPTVFLGSNMDAGANVLGKRIRQWISERKNFPLFFIKSLPPDDFYKLLANAACAVGNSSSFIREGAYFGTPVVLMGSRQNNRECGDNVLEVKIPDAEKISAAVKKQIKRGRYQPNYIFGDGQASQKIAQVLATVQPNIQKKFFDYV